MLISFQIIGGLVLLFLGGESLVKGAVALATNLKIPRIIIGLTIVALGTSAPELFVSIVAVIDDHPEIAIGNIIGSNISNILLVLAASALVHPLTIDPRLKKFDSLVLAISTILLISFCWTREIGMWEGFTLIACLALYNYTLYLESKREKSKLPEHQVEEAEGVAKASFTTPISLLICIVGTALLLLGSDTLVKGAVSLAQIMGISEAIIGLTLVAIGSSAPELATCISAARHKHSDVVIGNIIGSNIINILAGVGLASIISVIEIKEKFLNYDLWVLLIVTTALILVIRSRKNVSRYTGGVFFIGYIAYIFSQFLTL